MNWLDITLLCLAGIGFVKGLFDGVIKQVVSLIALLVGIFFCTKAALWLRGYILALGWFPEQGVTVLSYVAGFLLIVGVILLAGEILTRVVGSDAVERPEPFGGWCLGALLYDGVCQPSAEQYGDDRQGIGPDPAPGKGRIPFL